jgi:GNAT superfamily N-acetyltransferase
MINADTERVTALLPHGYRARAFEDRDREPLLAEGNTWFGPMEQADAMEWRTWERTAPDESVYRITVENASGRVVGLANMSAGGFTPHPDGAQSGGVSVAHGDRGRGIGSALLSTIEEEARRRGAPRLLGGASAAHRTRSPGRPSLTDGARREPSFELAARGPGSRGYPGGGHHDHRLVAAA